MSEVLPENSEFEVEKSSDLRHSPVVEDFKDVPLVVDCDKKASGSSQNESIVLASEADSRSVNDGHHILHVFAEEPEEQFFVPLLKSTRLIYENIIRHIHNS